MPTVDQIKRWRSRHDLTAAQAGEILGVANYRRYVSPHPQRLPAPNWFLGCAWSRLSDDEWRPIASLADHGSGRNYPEICGQPVGVRFAYIAQYMLTLGTMYQIRAEMKR